MPVSPQARQSVDRYRETFLTAQPFKHVMIEDFFEPSFAEQLLAEFPSFDKKLSINESGQTSGKAVHTNIRSISPAYQQLYATLSSRPFLDFVSQLSGIPDLLLDPKMFGGGTHENLHGQDLDPHVDFNYDEARQLHRRLNLIVYMNKEWRSEWGGALEIHSNPRRPDENQIHSFDPLFNRCVMFETNEYSWHGFPRIDQPEDKRHLSRKSISIYLYTKERPAEETAPVHATFYVQRPLPARFSEGHTLTAGDVVELQRLLTRRDQWIELYQKMELRKNAEIAESSAYCDMLAKRTNVPLTGYALVEGPSDGLLGDEWASSKVRLRIQPLLPCSGLVVRGYRPEAAPATKLRASVDGQTVAEAAATGSFALTVPVTKAPHEAFDLELQCDAHPGWAKDSGDDRDLAFIFTELRTLHPACPAPE
jgi:Rps23 Pro-64 3,4-dihydroxylase Tpa1-like proline 4-hydroxylase